MGECWYEQQPVIIIIVNNIVSAPVHEAIGCGQGGEGVQLGASDAVLTISCRVPSKWSRAPNITSLRMIKEWNQGSAQIYWHLHYSWGKSIKPQLADRLMKAIRPSSPQSLPLNDVGRTTQYIREGEGRKDERDRLMDFQSTAWVLLSKEPWVAAKKTLMLTWRCHQLLSGFLANDHLTWISRQLHISADKGYNGMKPEAVHRSPGIYLTTEENLGKSQLGDVW